MQNEPEAIQLPDRSRTVSTWADPFILCAVIVAVYLDLSPLKITTTVLAACIVAASMLAMGGLEWRRAQRFAGNYSLKGNLGHFVTAWLGTMVGLGLVTLAWCTLSEYRFSTYAPLWQMLPYVLAFSPIAAGIAIALGDHQFGASKRGGYQLGLIARGELSDIDWPLLRDDLLTWFIRGFFLPINFTTLVGSIDLFRGKEIAVLSGSFAYNEYYLLTMIYAVIIAAVTPGYLFGTRFIRTETKAVLSSFFGWTVTLMCYPPFWDATLHWFNYYAYTPNPDWMEPWANLLQNSPFWLATVGIAITIFSLIHLWGEAQFGIRSSNLSNRGIITVGPYRFSKHPVYIAKCFAWSLVWMPFAAGGNALEDVRLTALFLCVCVIFFLRSLAEEKLLSSDETYVAYALWIDEHGVFSYLGRLIPPLSFRWRLQYWRETSKSAASPTVSF
jgi:hypothetical protein